MNTQMTNVEQMALRFACLDIKTENDHLKEERAGVISLIGMAYLTLTFVLSYGNYPGVRSTLISVGRCYPNLKAKMDEIEASIAYKEQHGVK